MKEESTKNDMRKEITKQEEECTWLNRTIYCSEGISKIDKINVTMKPYSFTEVRLVSVLKHTPEATKDPIYENKNMECYKHPAEGRTQIANSIMLNAKAQVMSANLISETILKASHVLANSIDNLTNEIERKNKLDEYYMLTKEIEQFEDSLLQLGTFKEAYDELELIMIPAIKLDEYEVYVLNKLTGGYINYDEIIQLVKHYLANPLTILCEILKQRKIIVDPTTFCLEKLYETECEYKELEQKLRFVQEYDPNYELCKEVLMSHKKRYERLSRLSVNDNETTIINKLDELRQNESMQREIALSKYYIKISEDIEIINREILLNNLRRLHSELRNATRKYKIQSYNKE